MQSTRPRPVWGSKRIRGVWTTTQAAPLQIAQKGTRN